MKMFWPVPAGLPVAFLLSLAIFSPAEAQLFKKREARPQPSPPPLQRISQLPPANPYAHPQQAQPLYPDASPMQAAPMQAAPMQALPETFVYQQPIYTPPSYTLPYQGYRYQRSESRTRGGFFGTPKPSTEMLQLLDVVRARSEHISKFGLTYKFGGNHPREGGLDCSATMKYLLSDIGFKDIPRTSYHQYEWLRKNRTMKLTKTIPDHMGGRKGIRPGDLIFWGGTYDSGHRVSHVMIYLGQGGDGSHYMFGARGKKMQGLNGSGVDIFKLDSGYQKGLIGFGSLPGVS